MVPDPQVFALVAFITVATPGPTVLLALANGSRFGYRGAAFGIAGATVSDIFLIATTALGLGAILAASGLLFAMVKWLGVAYLAYVGFQMLRPPRDTGASLVGGIQERQAPEGSPAKRLFLNWLK